MERRVGVLVLDMDNCLILDLKKRTGPEEVKDEAWVLVFGEFPADEVRHKVEAVKREIAGGKGDRWDIARRVGLFFGCGEDVERRVARFGERVRSESLKIGVPIEHRKVLKETEIPIFINTSTPKEEAVSILEDLGVRKYFKGVHGRPETKVEGLRLILGECLVEPEEMLFVGDQESDWLAAREVGCQFVGMQTAKNKKWHEAKGREFPLIYSLAELKW